MRIWDLNPGYLNRQSLLGEHRELHGLVSVNTHHKKGYSKHPETLRWVGYDWALRQRHQLLAAEMALRGYQDNTPVLETHNEGCWPIIYIDEPNEQLKILAKKYREKPQGRLVLPNSAQQLWSQHKYSVLARDISLYEEFGREVSGMKPRGDISGLVNRLVECLKSAPSKGGMKNALQHMWGHISNYSDWTTNELHCASLIELLYEIQTSASRSNEPYLMNSTALSELAVWIES